MATYQQDSSFRITISRRGQAAALLTLCAMWTFYILSQGLQGLGDWVAYRVMYDSAGGYLRVQGRDPLFVWLIDGVAAIFGPQGYETFRQLVFAISSICAARLAWVSRSSVLVTVAVIFSTLILLVVVQIREGIAFLLLAMALAPLLVSESRGAKRTGIASVVGSFIHLGIAAFLPVWVSAAAMCALPNRVLRWRSFPAFLFVLGFSAGLVALWLVLRYPDPVIEAVADLGRTTTDTQLGGPIKIAYWVVVGAATVIVGRQAISSNSGRANFLNAYVAVLTLCLLPAVYTLCAGLVFTNFPVTAVIEFSSRLLSSVMALSLIITTVRGRGTIATAAIAALLMADAMRSIIPYWRLAAPL